MCAVRCEGAGGQEIGDEWIDLRGWTREGMSSEWVAMRRRRTGDW